MLEEFKRDEGLRHFHRGLALERANRMSEAVEEYHQAIENYPQLREAHAALGFYYQRAGLLAKAAEKFHIVVSLESDFLAYFNLGYVLVELNRYDDALDAFHQCLQLEPDDPATHYETAFIYYTRGDFDQALQYLQLPLESYPEDWEVHNLIGKCYLELRSYEEALAAFGQALMVAYVPQAQAELLDNIAAVGRYREFRSLNNHKDQVYARDGVVYLGSSQDDGLSLCETDDYHFTYPDIGTTLQRLVAIRQASHWQFTALVAVDRLSEPLTRALGHLLELPVCSLDDLESEDTALVVMAVAREAELMLVVAEHAPCTTVTFCLGLNWLRHNKILPDIIGIAARRACSVPWEAELRRLRADAAPTEQVDACVEQAYNAILQAARETPPDKNLPRQVRYYTRSHRRLSFNSAY